MHVVTFSSGWLDGVALLILEDPSGGWYMLPCIHIPCPSMPFPSGSTLVMALYVTSFPF